MYVCLLFFNIIIMNVVKEVWMDIFVMCMVMYVYGFFFEIYKINYIFVNINVFFFVVFMLKIVYVV